MTRLYRLGLLEAAQGIARGEFTPLELTTACLERIHSREERVRAWAYLEPEQALLQAEACNDRPATTPLHGIPVGIKDIIDTADMPTCYGSRVYADHRPGEDAECVRLLKQAGAVLMGKTVTTEFAFYAPGKTANPHAPGHTPGGSSSGSAAAVADFHVPVALGTQTAGSIIRPASFNGVFGYKPTYGACSVHGIRPLAPQLDTLGAFSRSAGDLGPLYAVLSGGRISAPAASRPEAVALVRTPAWDDADALTQSRVIGFAQHLKRHGIDVIETDESLLRGLMEVQRDCLALGAAASLGSVADAHPDRIRPQTRDLVEEGRRVDRSFSARLEEALSRGERFLSGVFSRADLIITPSAPGEAPAGLHHTGDPMFNRIWTLLRTPCLNMPLTRGDNGLPVGIQLVAARRRDLKLLSWAAYLHDAGYAAGPANGGG